MRNPDTAACKTSECGIGAAEEWTGINSLEDARFYNNHVYRFLTGAACDPTTEEGKKHKALHEIACAMENRANRRNIKRKIWRAIDALKKQGVIIDKGASFRSLTDDQVRALRRHLRISRSDLIKWMQFVEKKLPVKRSAPRKSLRTPSIEAAVAASRVAAPKAAPSRAEAPAKERDYWEVVQGPGRKEDLRYFFVRHRKKDGVDGGVEYKKGDFWRREPAVKRRPKDGDIILDLTKGAEAWVKRKTRRRPIDLTPGMAASYENSYLYKVRKLAARAYSKDADENLRLYLVDVAAGENKSRKRKKIRKKRKNKRK